MSDMSGAPPRSAVGNRDQMLEPCGGCTAVERFGADRDAFLQILGAAGHDQRRRGVEQRNIATGTGLAVKHALQRDCVGIGVAAVKTFAADTGESGVFRRYLEGTDVGVLEAGDKTGAGEGDLIE